MVFSVVCVALSGRVALGWDRAATMDPEHRASRTTRTKRNILVVVLLVNIARDASMICVGVLKSIVFFLRYATGRSIFVISKVFF
mmetsp:Transcript_109312/g.223296  ORF Transcript_109312/g.223296 Transcript_109312/m.223296 type:complete len:85 (+) Transcript_109312:1831-2085(+)